VDSPYPLVVEDSPDPADLALLEDHVAAAAVAAAGVGAEEEFGVFVRDVDGRILAGISASSGTDTASCRRCGSTRRSEVADCRELSWRRRRARPGAGAAPWSCFMPTTC